MIHTFICIFCHEFFFLSTDTFLTDAVSRNKKMLENILLTGKPPSFNRFMMENCFRRVQQ